MPVKINVNDLTLAHKGSSGTATATLPDMCKTPSPGGPVPLPYPNIAMSADLAKGTTTIKVDGGNMAANKGSELSRSTGDEAGTAGGVTSSTFIKEATWMLYSEDVFLEGKNACRLTDKLFMNHQNTTCMQGWIQRYMAAEGVDRAEACEMLAQYIDYVIGSDTAENHPNPPDPETGAPATGAQNMSGQSIDNAYPRGRLGEGAPPAGPLTTRGQNLMPRCKSIQHRMVQNRGFDLATPTGMGGTPPSTDGTPGSWETHDGQIEALQNQLGRLVDQYEEECRSVLPTDLQRRSQQQRREFDERIEKGRRWQNMNRPQPEHWEVPLPQPNVVGGLPLGW